MVKTAEPLKPLDIAPKTSHVFKSLGEGMDKDCIPVQPNRSIVGSVGGFWAPNCGLHRSNSIGALASAESEHALAFGVPGFSQSTIGT